MFLKFSDLFNSFHLKEWLNFWTPVFQGFPEWTRAISAPYRSESFLPGNSWRSTMKMASGENLNLRSQISGTAADDGLTFLLGDSRSGKHLGLVLYVHNMPQENTEPNRNSGALVVGSLHNINFLILYSLSPF